MDKTIWKYLVIALLIPALLCTVSCAKKSVKTDTAAPSVSGDASDKDAKRLRDEALEAKKEPASPRPNWQNTNF